jgi:hypothetical protein
VGAALRKNERQDETQLITKIDDFLNFTLPSTPHPNANVFFCNFFFYFHPVYEQIQGSGAVFPLLYG